MSRRFLFFPAPAATCNSVDFNGTDEFLAKDADVNIGIANAWSVGGWIKRGAAQTGIAEIIVFKAGGNSNNLIRIQTRDTNSRITIQLHTSTGTEFKDLAWFDIFPTDTWSFVVVTFDGTNVTVFKDGVDQGAPDITSKDDAGTMTSTDREVWIATREDDGFNEQFEGRIYSLGVWSAELDVNSIGVLYNSGDGTLVDWSEDSGAYTEASELEHWWRLGFDSEDIGADSGVNATKIDVMDDAANITAADDVVSDGPGEACA